MLCVLFEEIRCIIWVVLTLRRRDQGLRQPLVLGELVRRLIMGLRHQEARREEERRALAEADLAEVEVAFLLLVFFDIFHQELAGEDRGTESEVLHEQ